MENIKENDSHFPFLLQASKDLVCFLQLDHVNVYYGQDYRSKYKAPTDYCLALKVSVCLCVCVRVGLYILMRSKCPHKNRKTIFGWSSEGFWVFFKQK